VAGPPGSSRDLDAHGVPVADVSHVLGGEVIRIAGDETARPHPELAVLLNTSGTTGSPRLVRLSEANIRSNAYAIAAYLELAADERPISSLPLHYAFGLSVLNSHWAAGAAIVLTSDSVVQPSFWESFRRHGCTSLSGVPHTYQVLERVGFRQMDLPSLTTLLQAGGALDRRLTAIYAEHMAARGGRFFVMYGQTAASPRIAYVPPTSLPAKIGSAGVAIPGGRLRIEPADPSLGSTGEPGVGEVIYEGPNVMLGYATTADELALGDELGGTLRTGDLGYLDEDGFLYLRGRSKRIAKVHGKRVNLDEVESMMREQGPAAVVGGDDTLWVFCAFGSPTSMDELRNDFARRLGIHRSELRLAYVEAIPVTTSGKVDYEQLARRVAGG
jgi:acyl-CoA synthetase (AMP-forming)/AMP-acid ligase II